jgi:hypothetical protein
MTEEIDATNMAHADNVAPECKNILKVRDDPVPTWFSGSNGKYKLKEHTENSWFSKNEFSNKDLRQRIEPWLPSRHAILLGWASELPVLVQMNHLPNEHRPKSDDPDFWAVWSGIDSKGNPVERPVDWKVISDDWQQMSATQPVDVNGKVRSNPNE